VLKRDLILESLIQNFDGIAVSRGLFQEILSRTDPTSLELVGSEITKNNVPLAFDLLGLDFTLDSVSYFLKEVLESMRWFRMETIQNEAFYEFRLYHHYNIRWSFFLKSCLMTIFEFIHEEPAIDVSERVVKLRLSRKPLLNSNQRFEMLNMN
jgi:hypothetical protein